MLYTIGGFRANFNIWARRWTTQCAPGAPLLPALSALTAASTTPMRPPSWLLRSCLMRNATHRPTPSCHLSRTWPMRSRMLTRLSSCSPARHRRDMSPLESPPTECTTSPPRLWQSPRSAAKPWSLWPQSQLPRFASPPEEPRHPQPLLPTRSPRRRRSFRPRRQHTLQLTPPVVSPAALLPRPPHSPPVFLPPTESPRDLLPPPHRLPITAACLSRKEAPWPRTIDHWNAKAWTMEYVSESGRNEQYQILSQTAMMAEWFNCLTIIHSIVQRSASCQSIHREERDEIQIELGKLKW